VSGTLGNDRQVEPAVGELFVVMFEEQFAPMRRENTIARRRAQLVSSLAPDLAGMAIRLPAGVGRRFRISCQSSVSLRSRPVY
jgi:hypothetical protein